MNKFEKLDAWKEAHKLVLFVYKISTTFPKEEKFRLVDQVCRSASSIPANLAEGSARAYRKEYLQYVYQARGSLEETKYHLLLAHDLGYIKDDDHASLEVQTEIVGRLMNGLISYLRKNPLDERITLKYFGKNAQEPRSKNKDRLNKV